MSTSAEIVAWICFVAGIALLGVGAWIGLRLSLAKPKKDVKKAIDEALAKLDELEEAATGAVRNAAAGGTEGARVDAAAAASEVKGKTQETRTKLEDISSIIGSLPENLRFPGLLVLVGALLMGVATIQFGGHSLF